MTRMVASLSALIFSIILLVSGNAFLMTLLGIRLSIEQVDPATIGWVLVCYSIGFVAGTLFVNRVIGRVGHIRAFTAFAALAAVAALLHPLAVSMVFWAALRVVSGFSMAGVFVVIESWFSSRATNSNRGALFAIYQMVFFLSAAGGQLVVNLGDPASFMPFTLAAILVTLAIIPLSLTRMEAPPIEKIDRMSVFTLWRESSTGVVGALICGVLIGSFYALGPVYATLVGMDVAATSVFMASAIIAAMLLAWPLGRLCDRFDRRRVMFWIALGGAGAGIGAALLQPDQFWLLLLAVGLFTGLSATVYPVAVAITNDRMEHHRIVAASATLLLSYGIGSIIGPVVMAELVSYTGPRGLFLGNAAFLLLLAGSTWHRIRTTYDIPVEEQEQFVGTMPQASPVLAEIDPRNEEFHAPDEPDVSEGFKKAG
ncbi:MFS transporter [Marinobacter salicampi]|uniref:MFS transporter n=1 Tax=Marinobacter salicampi TaxID=435907 RepID=UPI0014099961|nr:MFS transporter [Marinobacter salicampi]